FKFLRHAVRFTLRRDQRHASGAAHRPLHRLEAALAHERSDALHVELGDAKPGLTTEMRDAANLAAGAGDLRAYSRHLIQRDLEGDVGLPVGQPVHIAQLRPRLRHGARMIGIDPRQVKTDCGLSRCFSKTNLPMTQRPLILASTSPYRRSLLERLGVPFEVARPGVDEAPLADEAPRDRAARLSLAKARAV